MAAYTGVGTRIREQMVKLGYVRPDGEPDVQRFSWDFRYDRTLLYAWLADKATPFKDLIRLARDLQISVEWLLTGQERATSGKAPRRQGRPTAGSLVLALLCGAASVLAWPSGVAEAGALGVADQVTNPSGNASSRTRRRWRRAGWAWPMHLLGCPA